MYDKCCRAGCVICCYTILSCVYNVKGTPLGPHKTILRGGSMAIYRNIYFRGKNNEIIRSLNRQITSQSHFMLGNTTCHWQHHLLLHGRTQTSETQLFRQQQTHQLHNPRCLLMGINTKMSHAMIKAFRRYSALLSVLKFGAGDWGWHVY